MKVFSMFYRAPEDGGSPGSEPAPANPAGAAQENADAWYSGIADEGLKAAASKFESRDKLLETVGYKAPDWRDSIQDEEARKFAKDSPDPDHFARRALELRQKIGKGIQPPGKDAKPEDIAAFRKAIGAGEKADDYAPLFKRPEGAPAATEEEVANEATWAEAMAEMAVPKAAAERLIAKFREDKAAEQAAIAAADKAFADRTEAMLKDKWKGDDFERNTKASERAIVGLAEKAGIDVEELRHMELKNGRFLLDDPNVRQLFASVGLEMAEGNLGPAMTASEASGIDDRIKAVRAASATAQASGDHKEANRLYQEEQALIARKQGTRPIVGSSGRAA